VFWEDLYAFKSRHTQWWERTSAKIWIKYMELAREYDAPLALNTLRMIRSTLLYETVAARLYSRVNAFKEHRNYLKSAGKEARKRVRKRIENFMFKGPSPDDYRNIEQLLDMANRAKYLAQRWLDQPPFRFSLTVDKFFYAVSVFLRTLLTFIFFTLGAGFLVLVWHLLKSRTVGFDIWSACKEVLFWGPYQLLVGFNLFLSIRKIMMRLFDKDVQASGTGLS
jgi:predicted unusual protein kinase regulating ubiquinone biosynthesis (AarF/ABC1/UbiB family)